MSGFEYTSSVKKLESLIVAISTDPNEDEAQACLTALFQAMKANPRDDREKLGTRVDGTRHEQQRCLAIPPKACWSVPLTRNHRCVGRISQLNELEAKLFIKGYCRRVAIIGLGGVGKTQVALELAYQTRDKRPDCSVFWIPANMENVQQAYQTIGQQLQIPGFEEKNEDIKLVQNYLS